MSQAERAKLKVNRYYIKVLGLVQGVGFRPFVFNQACELGLKGYVQNTSAGVYIDIEGPLPFIDQFVSDLKEKSPPLARIDSIEHVSKSPAFYESFSIIPSRGDHPKTALVSPDASICDQCSFELLDPDDRRYLYPFINCTNCGPRYTIIEDIPYDRTYTTMKSFPMCSECQKEYQDPADRRFHAQPNACPVCGPNVFLRHSDGETVHHQWRHVFKESIKDGKIFAVKGLGGFHLVCDANNPMAVKTLRERKNRPKKPFAIMCKDIDSAKKIVHISAEEEDLLKSPSSPIVLLDVREHSKVTESLAPGLSTIGIMLPYTPLHKMLFHDDIPALVMTSGNKKGLPLIKDNALAIKELSGIVDSYLLHDRDIQNRCDDSVIRVYKDSPYFLRRSRGFSPQPILWPRSTKEPVLALGSDMKNTYCLLKDKQAFIGPHIGDIENNETVQYFLTSFKDMKRFLDITPKITACDLHPSYLSSKIARESSPESTVYEIQHHHAHLASCMADNFLDELVLGIILDGTGYGLDGNIWGFEILSGNYLDFSRESSLEYIPLPGGESGVLNPWRMALSYLLKYASHSRHRIYDLLPEQSNHDIDLVTEIINKRINSPLTSSCGRFFDAVSALLGICHHSTYEGQAAIELMEVADRSTPFSPYPYDLFSGKLSPQKTIENLLEDINHQVPQPIIAAKFHHTIASMIVSAVKEASEKTNITKVVLSGGVFQNEFLLKLTGELLDRNKFTPYHHRQVPSNDGGVSLGQAVIAASRFASQTSDLEREG